jgi:hypothetical protein
MMTDMARNEVVNRFLATEAEWLQWIDADNTVSVGMIRRLLDTKKSLVTGVYVKRDEKNPEPILYLSGNDGMYQNLTTWRRGEILPIDAAGLGGCLVHRSVFDDVKKNYRILERVNGGIVVVHKDDIDGDIFDESKNTDGKVIEGSYHDRLQIPKHKHTFPYFMIEYARTEDYGFFERARRVGHSLWADTSVELGHVGKHIHKPEDWRKLQRHMYGEEK